MSKQIVLTGLRANSEFHIGNYLGAILPVVELQKRHAGEFQVNMFVPDLHSFTTPIDHNTLYRQCIDNLKVFVAAGLDIDNADTFIYRQSFIPAHSELTWILSCFEYFGQMNRMTQFKEKSSDIQDREYDEKIISGRSVGLFIYPILMAADILLYGATWVPVGDDQKQHLELARDLGSRLNNKFGDLFTLPNEWSKQMEFSQRNSGVRIRSLRNPEKKMSKSVSDPSGTIMITDNPQEAAKKVMRAETDSLGSIHFDFDKQPGVSNLLQILALLAGRPQSDVNVEWEGKSSYGDLKQSVAGAVEKFLTDLQASVAAVDEDKLLERLAADEVKMNEVANAKLNQVQKAVGLRA